MEFQQEELTVYNNNASVAITKISYQFRIEWL